MARSFFKNMLQVVLVVLVIGLLLPYGANAAGSASNTLLPLVGDALSKARAGDWADVEKDLQQFEASWKQISQQDATITDANREKLEKALSDAKAAAQGSSPNADAVIADLGALAKATDGLTEKKAVSSTGKQEVQKLSVYLDASLKAIDANNFEEAKSQFGKFEDGWKKAEGGVRADNFATYSAFETKISMAHIAVNAQAPNAGQAKTAMQSLAQLAQDYLNGKQAAAAPQTAQEKSLADLLPTLDGAVQDIDAGDAAEASAKVQHFIEVWPSVEGQVSTRSAKAYNDTEVNMTQALQLLSASPADLNEAKEVINKMLTTLKPYAEDIRYTAFDAGMVLFREGLEALLVVSALLAFLQRSGNRKKQAWIWTGVGSGLALSVVLAVVMTVFFSGLAVGSNRETMEGVIGLAAVVMMLTVGVWLHSKSSGQAWSQYIQQQVSTALAKGSLWSLMLVSFLAIVREGAETILFYLGMAASIDKSQLLLGIGGALVVLVILGAAIIRFSVRIPMKPFFLVASLFIYYVAFKFLGQSVHVLQIQNWFSAHTVSGMSSVEWLGIYPTWETCVAQAVLLVLIAAFAVWNNRKAPVQKTVAS